MSIRLGRAGIRTLVPNQKFEITITIFAEQTVRDIEIAEELKKGLELIKNPKQKKITFSYTELPELAFLKKGHAVSVSYWVKVKSTPDDILENNGVMKVQISGKALAKNINGELVKTRIKTSNFFIVAPMVIIEKMDIIESGELVLVVRNNGNIDAKRVEFNIAISIDINHRKIQKMIIQAINEDHLSNKYVAQAEVDDENIFEIVNKQFIETLLNLHKERKESDFVSSFEQQSPISLEADGRERLVCVTPVTT